MAANAQIFYVSIAVYRGVPLDYQRYRHTALCFRPALPPSPSASAPPSPPLSSTELTASPPPADGADQNGSEEPRHPDFDPMSGPAIIMHAVSTSSNNGNWELSVLASTVPAEMPNRAFAKEVPVGALLRPLSKAQLVNVVSHTEVDNEDPEFNCQVWVEAALMRLSSEMLLDLDDYHNGLDAMIDATMEAVDELCI